jgi:hypothetical protein
MQFEPGPISTGEPRDSIDQEVPSAFSVKAAQIEEIFREASNGRLFEYL